MIIITVNMGIIMNSANSGRDINQQTRIVDIAGGRREGLVIRADLASEQ